MSQKIFVSAETTVDSYAFGQRLTVYVDLENDDLYWVDLDSVISENERSRKILNEYNELKGDSILNQILFMYPDQKDLKSRILLTLVVITVSLVIVPISIQLDIQSFFRTGTIPESFYIFL
jgi:hypothetical protein